MWQVFSDQASAEAYLRAEGYKQANGYWTRGIRYLTFSRVSIGRCNNGQYVITSEPHIINS